jgi:thiaminase/transcriptional activator TenA
VDPVNSVRFSDELWHAAEGTYRAILDHPFLLGLADGTLPRGAFRHFVVQDSHYLRDYARALAVCAAKAPTEADVRAFAGDAVGALVAEQEMHADFLLQLPGERPPVPPRNPGVAGLSRLGPG